jgi:hypothetical protein
MLIVCGGLAAAALVTAALAAQMPGGGNYDPGTVVTVKGVVEEVKLTSFGRGRLGGGVHLGVRSDGEVLDVHLGPQAYLEEQNFEVESGQTVEVVGSRVSFGGKPAVIAREIKVDEKSLQLREESGRPLWAGQTGPGMPRADAPQGCGAGGCCKHKGSGQAANAPAGGCCGHHGEAAGGMKCCAH